MAELLVPASWKAKLAISMTLRTLLREPLEAAEPQDLCTPSCREVASASRSAPPPKLTLSFLLELLLYTFKNSLLVLRMLDLLDFAEGML